MTHHHLQQSDDFSFFFVLSHHHDHQTIIIISLSLRWTFTVGTLSKMHTPRYFLLLLLHQMWWRLKGNSYARGLTKMNLMSRFLFDFFFFVLFCSFVFSPANNGRHPTACRKNKQTRNRNKQQATPPTHSCASSAQSRYFKLSLLCRV